MCSRLAVVLLRAVLHFSMCVCLFVRSLVRSHLRSSSSLGSYRDLSTMAYKHTLVQRTGAWDWEGKSIFLFSAQIDSEWVFP